MDHTRENLMRIVLLFCLLCLAGCGRSQTLPWDVVAKVNDYSITVEELKREVANSSAIFKNYPEIPPAELKSKILEEMIANQLLLEEAQKLNVDKDPSFMLEVESHWRQTLLKNLIKKKNAALLVEHKITDVQLRALYARETENLELDMVTLADETSAKELSAASGPAVEETVKKLGAKVVSRIGPSGWSSGDLPEAAEEKLWSLAAGEVSSPLWSPEEGWFVARVLSKEKVTLPPFEVMRGALQKRIVREILPDVTDRWIGELKAKAKIISNKQALDKI
jgi:hypothetical protein